MLEMARWRKRWTMAEWVRFLAGGESGAEVLELRRCTHTGRPLGAAEFVSRLEKMMQRPLAPRKAGRRKSADTDAAQAGVTFVA